MAESSKYKNEVSIVIAGAAGQGIQTVEILLTKLLKLCGYNFFATKEYMSRVRGGNNSTEIRVAGTKVSAYVERIDLLFPLNKDALNHVKKRIMGSTRIIGEKSKLVDNSGEIADAIIDISFENLAKEIGGQIFSNIIVVGVISGLFRLDTETIESFMASYFARKGDEIVANNLKALRTGYEIGKKLTDEGTISIEIDTDISVKDDMVLNGAEAVGIGAIAGGCNFISAYPMSPSTAVLVFLAQQSKQFDIIVEQAEDEIAGINMALGAWYTGARALVSSSGGGFALMTEGTSLAGMIESPVVIHIAQRPGPATGLPTRTEQGDLDLALYAGHGEFPRIIYAPGSIEDGVYLTHRAFNLADKYQIPVFILTDQYYVDSYYNSAMVDVSAMKNEYNIVETGKDYKRFAVTDSGISPRGVPGHGSGLVAVDSDEHDEEGHITEDPDVRTAMTDKRLRKFETMKNDILLPERIGPKNCDNLIVCWGTTCNIACEALRKSGNKNTAILHFKQVFPLPHDIKKYFEGVKKIAIVENNATGQFGKLLKLHTGIEFDAKILKYNGYQFSVEELTEQFGKIFE
ncbi:MAG: 2-oxoacid:acceptor oxidoreductase subunit alpha [Candidatus Latescibacteria bacterium]|nr:2-oxoacid:acceptor oxidoreductase subunit alpha [Candidatus Latescibacterota bacterium]